MRTNAKVPPALTAEEWREGAPEITKLSHKGVNGMVAIGPLLEITHPIPGEEGRSLRHGYFDRHRHILAALALHGQPFGFTRRDVDTLRSVAKLHRITLRSALKMPDANPANADDMEALADRIEALLPPE